MTTHPDARPDLVGPAYESVANLLSIPPIHVSVVAEAAVRVILSQLEQPKAGAPDAASTLQDRVYDVSRMTELVQQ